MDSIGKFWLGMWAIIGTAFLALVVAIYAHNTDKLNKLNAAIEQGVNPQVAQCAIEDWTWNPVCIILATELNTNETTGE